MSGINAKRENRIKGIVDRISSEDDFDSIKWITQAPVQNFCRSAVDEIAQKNAELHNDMGLEAKIVRQTVGENCKWCDALAGEYVYPDVPHEVYQRHDDCDCIVEYMPGDGRVQNVYSKQWVEDPSDLELRKSTDINMGMSAKAKETRRQLNKKRSGGTKGKALENKVNKWLDDELLFNQISLIDKTDSRGIIEDILIQRGYTFTDEQAAMALDQLKRLVTDVLKQGNLDDYFVAL